MIQNFDDMIQQHQLSRDALKRMEKCLSEQTGTDTFQFTALQKEAFGTKGFWRGDPQTDSQHIIVQGATSSGKTLVSEIAIMDCLKSRKKSIVLVPLKAMVRERCETIQQDLEPLGTRQVYASSSDFQDHDGDIVNGDYEVAIIVYEKFFAMMAQSANKMLNDCALLIVDEMQMLSSKNRGPKLEIGIQKILRRNEQPGKNMTETRIMCLTTCDCKVDYIYKWLTVRKGKEELKPVLISCKKRPVGLKEHVIQMDGSWRMRYTLGENDIEGSCPKGEDEGKIDVPEYVNESRTEQAKQALLKALLQKIHIDNPGAKILVFANGREKTMRLAEFISQQNLMEVKRLSDAAEDIGNYEGDEYQKTLKEKLLPRSIAFHNAALSGALREFIEKLYRQEGDLCYVVATETLTIGMNMPVDVMILYDTVVHRGGGMPAEPLTSQEYKNFAGRAGRLGQTNRIGESYIFATTQTDADKYWDTYVNCRTEEIESALIGANEKEQAPYYLSLLGEEAYTLDDLEKLWNKSFSNCCGGTSIDMKNIVKELKRAKLCRQLEVDEEENEEATYELSDFGRILAPYAFSLNTCFKIRKIFFDGGYKRVKRESIVNGETSVKYIWQTTPEPGKGGLPETVTHEDIKNDKYLLDILYALCGTEEIRRMGQLKLPAVEKNPEKARAAMDKVEAKLREMIEEKDGKAAKCTVWEVSPLPYMLENGYDHELEDKECIMRAILLWHWTKGETIEEIKKETGFGSFVSIVCGDVARMAEAASYQLEAIYHCYGGYTGKSKFASKALGSLYALSTRVNYGMRRDLVIIMNRQLRGIDRKTVLKIGEACDKSGKYDSPAHWLKYAPPSELQGIITEQQRNDLLRRIDDLYLRDRLTVLLDALQNDLRANPIGEEARGAIEQIYKIDSDTADERLLEPLGKLFLTEDVRAGIIENPELEAPVYDDRASLHLFMEDCRAKLEIKGETGDKIFIIGIYTENQAQNTGLSTYFESNKNQCTNILLLKEEAIFANIRQCKEDGSVWELDGDKGAVKGIHIAMSFRTFAELVAQDIALDDNDAQILASVLQDVRGVFRMPGLQIIRPFLQNYDVVPVNQPVAGQIGKTDDLQHQNTKKVSETATLRILYDKRLEKTGHAFERIIQKLQDQQIPYRVLKWGESLAKELPDAAPTLLFLDWDTVKTSKSLDRFCTNLRRNHYRNTYALFESEDSYLQWGTEDPRLPCRELQHSCQLDDTDNIVRRACYMLNNFRKNNYLIGVSYAHDKALNKVRPEVKQLYDIVEFLNEEYGESAVLFDQNPSSENSFDGNGAIPATLNLYGQCKYFIVLDDGYYDSSDACKKEGQIILKKINQGFEAGHLWLLHPDNAEHCSLFNAETDYSTRLNLKEENTRNVAAQIIQKINEKMECV